MQSNLAQVLYTTLGLSPPQTKDDLAVWVQSINTITPAAGLPCSALYEVVIGFVVLSASPTQQAALQQTYERAATTGLLGSYLLTSAIDARTPLACNVTLGRSDINGSLQESARTATGKSHALRLRHIHPSASVHIHYYYRPCYIRRCNL